MTTKKLKQSSAARCDYCSAELGCLDNSIRAREYWRGEGFTTFNICDACLPSAMDDFPQLEGEDRLMALRLLHARGVNLPWIDESIIAARGIVVPRQLADLREQREKVLQLYREGELVAAVWAAQALWNAVGHLNESMATRKTRLLGEKFSAGRKSGTKGPVRKAIEKLLKKAPNLKNPELWDALAAKPPRGWTFFNNHLGQYIEGPNPAEDHMVYRRFCTVCGEERKKLKL